MANQTRSAGAFSEGNLWGVGAYHWVDGNNMLASDNAYATVLRTGTPIYSYTAMLTDFGFTIPAGSVINKISVLIEAKSDNLLANRIDWVILLTGGVTSLMNAMGLFPSDVSPDEPLTTTDDVYTFNPAWAGDPNLWGYTWTPALINDSSFGTGFDCYLSGRTDSISVDRVQISVDYTEGESPTGICEGRGCDIGFESMSEAIKAIIGKFTGPGDYHDCVGMKMALEMKKCQDLTDLKDCGTNYTLEQAFKAALKDDGCGGAVLRSFVLPPEGGGFQ